jgi:hypothetical protein
MPHVLGTPPQTDVLNAASTLASLPFLSRIIDGLQVLYSVVAAALGSRFPGGFPGARSLRRAPDQQ